MHNECGPTLADTYRYNAEHYPLVVRTNKILIGVIIALALLNVWQATYTVRALKIANQQLVLNDKVIRYAENVEQTSPRKYVGEFSFTHYCDCPICTKSAKGSRTATGHKPRQGRTVAVDPKVIPLHSIIYVEDIGYFVAEDVGGGVHGNHIDIYVDDHEEAKRLGTLGGKKKRVYIMTLGDKNGIHNN